MLSIDQLNAVNNMFNGCVVDGGVGSGKSRTSLAYYVKNYGGVIDTEHVIKRMDNPPDLYIITTARKRDSLEWEDELNLFGLSIYPEKNTYKNKVVVDSWNNIGKFYDERINKSFFIFDEHKLGSFGKWAKAFITLAKNNQWILLSATPGDTWTDWLPVFIANGYFKNKTDFYSKHAIFSRFTTYPKIEKYYNEAILIAMRKKLLVHIDVKRDTIQHHIDVKCSYDRSRYLFMANNRWNIYEDKPMENAAEYCLCLRRCVNSDLSRLDAIAEILKIRHKAIIFYSYDYELDMLRQFFDGVTVYAEWNGHKHQPVPVGDSWVYLVEYFAGAEAWNCITTDTIIFYSQNYSYRTMVQSSGRIDRRNTPYIDLYYYHLKSDAPIEKAITFALKKKKKFNERDYAPKDWVTVVEKIASQ